MEEIKESKIEKEIKTEHEAKVEIGKTDAPKADTVGVKTRKGSGYLKQLYSTARVTAGSTQSNFRSMTTFLVNFLPIDKVDASEMQMRTHFDEHEINTLADSIKQHGVLQPILVTQNGERYKVIAGERRLRASKQAGVERIPARVLTTDDKAAHEIALRENLDRVDLHPLEEGEGYLTLVETKAFASHEALAKAFGKPKSRITECIGYTRLPDATKTALLNTGLKNRSILRRLLQTPPEEQIKLIKEASGKEEQILLGSEQDALDNAVKSADGEGAQSNTGTASKNKPKKEVKPFSAKCDDKGVKIPGFTWKVGEGPDRLRHYLDIMEGVLKMTQTQHMTEKSN
jgi:ParB/RepB/Spo0J family partition protein